MPQIGWLNPETGERLLFDEALEQARQMGNLWGQWPYEVLAGMKANLTHPRPKEISVTQLLGCARNVKLERATEYFADPQSNFAAFRGTVVHSVMEDHKNPDATAEVRLEREIDGVIISGQPDYTLEKSRDGRIVLRDWKSTNELPQWDNAYAHHQQQVNIYIWLLGLDPAEVDPELVYFSMKGVKIIPLKKGGTGRNGRKIAEQVWPTTKTEAFIRERLAMLKGNGLLPYEDVPDEDLWLCKYCPVRNICYRRAAQEARAKWEIGEDVKRLPPREQEKKKKGKK